MCIWFVDPVPTVRPPGKMEVGLDLVGPGSSRRRKASMKQKAVESEGEDLISLLRCKTCPGLREFCCWLLR